MRYSNKNLTDDNFDEEYEALTSLIGNLNSDEWEVYAELPKGFTMQDSEDKRGAKRGFVEWIRLDGVSPDISGIMNNNIPQALVSGEIAFEFGNKFLSLRFNDAL